MPIPAHAGDHSLPEALPRRPHKPSRPSTVALAMTILLSLAYAPNAVAFGVIDDYPHQVVTGTPVTFTYAPDPGQNVSLIWEVTDNPTTTTACSEANPAGCRYTAQWSTPGLKDICLNRANGICNAGGGQLTVITPIDLLPPIIVKGLEAPTVTVPTTFTVYTTKQRLVSSLSAGGKFGDNPVRLVGKEGVYNKFQVTAVAAPSGSVRFEFLAFDSGGVGVRHEVTKQVAYRGPTYGQFGLKLTGTPVANRYNVIGRVMFLSVKHAKWSLATKLQQRAGGKWKTLAERKSSGKDMAGRVQYRVNTYGTSLLVQGKAWQRARTACQRGATLRVVVAGKVTKPNGQRLWSKTLSRRVQKSTCTTTDPGPRAARGP